VIGFATARSIGTGWMTMCRTEVSFLHASVSLCARRGVLNLTVAKPCLVGSDSEEKVTSLLAIVRLDYLCIHWIHALLP